MTEEVDTLLPKRVHEALADVRAELKAVGKEGYNEQQRYNFRGIDAVVNAVSPVLARHRVLVLPVRSQVDYEQVEVGKNRSLMRQCSVLVTYWFVGPAGDHLDIQVPGESMDSGDKATPKAMSVAFRTGLLQALCLPTTDQDPDAESYTRSAARKPEPAAEPVARLEGEALALWKEGFAIRMANVTGVEELPVFQAELLREVNAGRISPAVGTEMWAATVGVKARLEGAPA